MATPTLDFLFDNIKLSNLIIYNDSIFAAVAMATIFIIIINFI